MLHASTAVARLLLLSLHLLLPLHVILMVDGVIDRVTWVLKGQEANRGLVVADGVETVEKEDSLAVEGEEMTRLVVTSPQATEQGWVLQAVWTLTHIHHLTLTEEGRITIVDNPQANLATTPLLRPVRAVLLVFRLTTDHLIHTIGVSKSEEEAWVWAVQTLR